MISSKCVRRSLKKGSFFVEEEAREELGEIPSRQQIVQGCRLDEVASPYPHPDQKTESGWICRKDMCTDTDENRCCSRTGINGNSRNLSDAELIAHDCMDETVTPRRLPYAEELPHPSKLRKATARSKVTRKKQRDLAVEQHIQQLRQKQTVYPSKRGVQCATDVAAAGSGVSVNQRLPVILPKYVTLPALQSSAASLKTTSTENSGEVPPEAVWRKSDNSDDEDEDWLKEHWKCLPHDGKPHEE